MATIAPTFALKSQESRNAHSQHERNYLCLAGVGVTHSIAPPMHNYIAAMIGKSTWRFENLECPTAEEMMRVFRAPSFAGGVVTMPYKKVVMPFLDGVDNCAARIGAVNNVYIGSDGSLRGTNTDWRGIKGCLLDASKEGIRKTAMIIGAGGASRAAVYTLHVEMGCSAIYIINRDAQEVEELLQDAQAHTSGALGLNLIHVTSIVQAEALATPFYVIGTVPDLEPKSEEELKMQGMLRAILNADGEKGVLLDMCFKPRNTRILKLGRSLGWQCVDGTGVIGHQIEEQWRLWAGESASAKIPKQEAWAILNKGARESKAINF